MNIMIIYSVKPFITNFIDVLAERMREELSKQGDTAMCLRFPYDNSNEENAQSAILAHSFMRIDNTSILISLNAPCCYLHHSRHILWLQEDSDLVRPELLPDYRTIMYADEKCEERLEQVGTSKLKFKSIPKTETEWKKLIEFIKSV